MSGGIVITTLKGIYENIYRFVDKRNVIERESTKLGWYTSSLTKTNAFMGFRKDYNDGLIKINNPELLKEMKMYSNTDLAESSTITRHFDLLMSAVIAWGVKDYLAENQRMGTVTNSFLQ
jgi:predicted transcriptional regulator